MAGNLCHQNPGFSKKPEDWLNYWGGSSSPSRCFMIVIIPTTVFGLYMVTEWTCETTCPKFKHGLVWTGFDHNVYFVDLFVCLI